MGSRSKTRLAGIALAMACAAAVVAERVEPSLELSGVRVEVTWVVNSDELAEIRQRYESRPRNSRSSSSIGAAYRDRRDDHVKGFSVLGKRDGKYVCLIFVKRPTAVNDARMLQLGHELAHCLLGSYHD